MGNHDKKQLVFLLSKLISAQTVNPPGREQLAARVVSDFLGKADIKFQVKTSASGRANVLATVGSGRPVLMIACHMDVVPAGNDWKTDPFKLTVRGNKLLGRGVCDNKGQLAALLLAAAELKRRESDLCGTLQIVAAADEEKGSTHGLHWLIEKRLVKPDFGIIPDSPDGNQLIVAQKRILHIKVTARGKAAHGSTPELGQNSIIGMSSFFVLLDKHRFAYQPDRLLKKPSVNVGMIKGGNAPNVVPDTCEAIIDFRVLPDQTAASVIRDLRRLAKRVSRIRFAFELIMEGAPTRVSPQNQFLRTVIHTMREINGRRPELVGIGGGTDSKPFILKGIPMADIGIKGSGAHVANESVDIRELLKLKKILVKVALNTLHM